MTRQPPGRSPGRREAIDAATRTALEASLGDRIVSVDAVRWGFSTTSATLALESGELVAIQQRSAREAARIRRASRALAAAGVHVPAIRAVANVASTTWVIYDAVVGQPGPELLADQRGADLARKMGRLLRRISTIDPTDVPVDPAWSEPTALRAAVVRWGKVLPSEVRSDVLESVTRLAATDWRVTVSHGDFVPANVVVGEDGQLIILDLAEVAGRHPLVDPAWWELIVRHHHPRVAGLSANLRQPPGLASPGAAEAAVSRAAQLAVAAHRERDHRLALLRTAIRWLRTTSRPMPETPTD